MTIRSFSVFLLLFLLTGSIRAQVLLPNPPCDPVVHYNTGGQQVVYTHAVPTPWFAVKLTADWVATIDTAYIGMGVDRASTSGAAYDTLEVRVLADQLPTYFILDQLTVLIPPNIQGLVVDAMYIVEFKYQEPLAWVDPAGDFYLAWRVKGPNGDVARMLMTKPAAKPQRSLIINQNSTTTLATDFMRTQLQLGTTDSVEFKAKVHACWPYGYPVELTAFTARYIDGVALLEWHTATEENNNGFIIERLAGSSDIGTVSVWQRIGFVQGHGTTTEARSYSFIDPDPASVADARGVVRYRLRQIDYDGRTDLSPEVEIAVSRTLIYALDQPYPNPVSSSAASVSLAFSLPAERHARLEVFDALGRSVALVADDSYPAGRHAMHLSAAGLRSGVYFCRLTSDGQALTRRFTVTE
ncbi:MAG: T9SS type A sorting domain-containing protein [Bacteroidetes bacterium]|nr:T9SS type A sorting domain-containing protein [Bacteroidota bacterium]